MNIDIRHVMLLADLMTFKVYIIDEVEVAQLMDMCLLSLYRVKFWVSRDLVLLR